MALGRAPDRLPCDTALGDLVDQVAEERAPLDPAHQAACPHCRAALAALREAWADLRGAAAEPVAIPRDLSARIMSRVRALARRLAGSVVLAGPRGDTRVGHPLVGTVARRAALAVPGVTFASARPDAVAADPGRITLALRLVIAFGPAVEALAGDVRAAVERRVRTLTGAGVDAIDILVDDVAAEPDQPSNASTGSVASSLRRRGEARRGAS